MDKKELMEQLEQLKKDLQSAASEDAKKQIEEKMKSLDEKIKAFEGQKAEFDDLKKKYDELKDAFDKNQPVIDDYQANKQAFAIGGKFKDKKEEDLGTQVSNLIVKNMSGVRALGRKGWLTLASDMTEAERKAAGTMTTANVDAVGTDSIPYLLSDADPGLNRVARRKPFLMQLCNVGSISKTYAQWAEQANPDPGAAGMTAEGAAKTQTDFDVNEKSQKVEKVTAYIKVSTEMLDDLDFIRSEINNELVELVMLKLDSQIFGGDGNTPNLKGITQFSQAVSFGGLAGNIAEPNYLDVLRAAISQIATNQFTQATEIMLHPEDAALLDLTKADDGHYVMPPFSTQDRASVKGVRVVENTLVSAGNFLAADFTKSNVRVRKNLSISVGYENDDFTKNLVTILAELRAVHYIKGNHVQGFVYDSFADGIAALDAAS